MRMAFSRFFGSGSLYKLKGIILMSLLFGLVFLAIFSLDRFSSATGPRLELDSTCALDLGKGEVGQTLTGTFTLKNSGSAPLNFRLYGSCACTSLSPQQGEIPPGRSDPVSIGIRLTQEGKTENVAISIMSNDPDNSTMVYRVRAKCPAPLIAWPTHVFFGNVVQGRACRATLKIYDAEEKPVTSEAKIIATTSNPSISVSSLMLGNGEAGLQLALAESCPRGTLSAEIQIRLAGNEKSITVPIAGEILGPLRVSPKTIFLVRDDKTGFHKDAIFLVSGMDDQPLGSVKEIKACEELRIEDLSDGSPRHKKFVLRAGPAFSVPARVAIRFDNLAEDAVVDIIPANRK